MWNFRFDSRAWYASAALETTNLTEKENPCLRSVLRKNYARESLDKHRLVAQVSDNHSLGQPLIAFHDKPLSQPPKRPELHAEVHRLQR